MALYRTYSDYLKEKYNEKVYKIPIALPVTCPNRDGTCLLYTSPSPRDTR